MAAIVSRSDIGGGTGAVVGLLFLVHMLLGLGAADDDFVDVPLLGYRQHVVN